ncbi:MAG: hypothetical protein AAF662_00595 [Pseudomonadota bacterium]
MQDLVAFFLGIDPVIAVAAPTVTWVLTNAVSFFRLKERLSPPRSTHQDPILVRMAGGKTKQKTMRELYDSLDAAQDLANSVIKKDRRLQLVRAVLVTVAMAVSLFITRLFVGTLARDAVVIPLLIGTLAGVVYLFTSQKRLRSLSKKYFVGSDEGSSATRKMMESAKDAIASGKKQVKSVGPTELEFQFLEQFLATVDSLKHTESILLVKSLEAGQQSINATYQDQIAQVIGLKLDQLLRETVVESPGINSKEFAELAFGTLKDLGYTNLVVFEEKDIENLVGPATIQSFKDEKHPKLISKNMKNFMPLRS